MKAALKTFLDDLVTDALAVLILAVPFHLVVMLR